MTESVNEAINYKGVYRTAPAAPGLLITFRRTCDNLFSVLGGSSTNEATPSSYNAMFILFVH